jgi:hypothetical protein
LAVKVLVTGVRSDGQPFYEETCTSVVNANGALMHLTEKVSLGQVLTIRNLLSNQELPCAILDLATSQEGISEVALEFLQPDPRFWRISFPPPDWSPRSPEAKRLALAPIPFSQLRYRK